MSFQKGVPSFELADFTSSEDDRDDEDHLLEYDCKLTTAELA